MNRYKYPYVEVQHQRKIKRRVLKRLDEVQSKGGATIIVLVVQPGVAYIGASKCNLIDVYNKRKGKSIAFGRLMKALDFLVKNDHPVFENDWWHMKVWLGKQIGKVDWTYFWKAYKGEKII